MLNVRDKKFNIALIVVIAIAVVGMILGGIFDFDIANSIRRDYVFNDPTSVNAPLFGVFMTAGILPTTFFGGFGGIALLRNKEKNGFWRWIFRIGGFLATTIIAYSTYVSIEEMANIYQATAANALIWKIILLILTILFTAGGILVEIFCTKEADQKDIMWVGITIVSLIAIYFLVGELIKYSWSRPRPRAIYNAENPEQFRNFWELNFLYALKSENGELCKSFISGHVANCTTYIGLTPLVLSLTKLGKKKYTTLISTLVAAAYTIFLGISRLYAQAHFLSDISGAIIVILLLIYFVFTMIRLIRKEVEKKGSN